MISNGVPVPSAAAISATSGAMLPASFLTGTTTETAGVSLSREGASLMLRSCCGLAVLLGTPELACNLLHAPPGRPRQGPHLPVRLDDETEAPRREPVAHQ